MTPTDADLLAVQFLGRGPCVVGDLVGLLLKRGLGYSDARGVAEESLERLVAQGKAGRSEVHGVTVYHVPDSAPTEQATDEPTTPRR